MPLDGRAKVKAPFSDEVFVSEKFNVAYAIVKEAQETLLPDGSSLPHPALFGFNKKTTLLTQLSYVHPPLEESCSRKPGEHFWVTVYGVRIKQQRSLRFKLMTTKLFPISLSQEKRDGIERLSGYQKLKNGEERVQWVHLSDSINIASHHFDGIISGIDKLLGTIRATMKLGRNQEPDYKYVFPPKAALRPLAKEILFGLWPLLYPI